MFGNILKSLKNSVQPVKTMASSNFLSAINNLEEVKVAKETAVKTSPSPIEDKYGIVFNDGLAIFFHAIDNIGSDYGYDLLEKAAEKFSEAIEIRKSKAEPYFYLSYIFFILKEMSLSIKYFKVSEFMNPELKGLEQLRKDIYDYLDNSEKKEAPSTTTKVITKPITTTTQPYNKPTSFRPTTPVRQINKI
ncbi:MAG: hypothetical protein U0457_06995 [Candidatus Sericytochromatia bacterium]